MEFPNKEIFEAVIAINMRIHYRLMEHQDFWYNKEKQKIDAMLCLEASNLRLELKKATADWNKATEGLNLA